MIYIITILTMWDRDFNANRSSAINGDLPGNTTLGMLTILTMRVINGILISDGGSDNLFAFNNSGDAATGATISGVRAAGNNAILF